MNIVIMTAHLSVAACSPHELHPQALPAPRHVADPGPDHPGPQIPLGGDQTHVQEGFTVVLLDRDLNLVVVGVVGECVHQHIHLAEQAHGCQLRTHCFGGLQNVIEILHREQISNSIH